MTTGIDVFSFNRTGTASPTPQGVFLHRTAGSISALPAQWQSWLLLLGWIGLAAALITFAASRNKVELDPGFPRVLQGWLPARGLRPALIWFEVLVAVRSPQIIVGLLTAVLLFTASLWCASTPQLSSVSPVIATSIPVVSAFNGLYAVGRTLPTRWVTFHISASSTAWIFPKVMANFMVFGALCVLMTLITLSLSLVSIFDLPGIGARALAAFFMALLAGMIIPYSRFQPFSNAASGFLLGIFLLTSSVSASLLGAATGPSVSPLSSLILAALSAWGFIALAYRESRHHERPI